MSVVCAPGVHGVLQVSTVSSAQAGVKEVGPRGGGGAVRSSDPGSDFTCR